MEKENTRSKIISFPRLIIFNNISNLHKPLARKKIVTSFRRLRLISRELRTQNSRGGEEWDENNFSNLEFWYPECGAQIYSVEKLEDVDWSRASVQFHAFFPPTFGFAPWMRATSSRLYSKACRREKWPVDTPLFSPRDEIFARCLSRDFHPLFEICFLVFFFPPPLRSEAIRELEDEGCRNICWEIVHCFVTIGSWILGGMKMENNVFIWKIKEFVWDNNNNN